MKIGNNFGIGLKPGLSDKIEQTKKSDSESFGKMFTDFVKDVNSAQNHEQQITKDFVNGKDVEIHEVMIAGQKAKTSLELLMEIRNKALDMYREITRMQ